MAMLAMPRGNTLKERAIRCARGEEAWVVDVEGVMTSPASRRSRSSQLWSRPQAAIQKTGPLRTQSPMIFRKSEAAIPGESLE